jgi:polyvinyl alcohol dehydrogenase (cytochrome)
MAIRTSAIRLIAGVAILVAASGAAASAETAGTGCRAAGKAAIPDLPDWNGWGNSPRNARMASASPAGILAADLPRLRLKWAFGFDGDSLAFSQPAVVDGRLFAGGASGAVFALDPRSGCRLWTFKADAGVRTGFVVATAAGSPDKLVVFGDQHGVVYALDAASGILRWRLQADPHPAAMITGTPQVSGGALYVPVASYEENFAPDAHYACCTFRGSLLKVDLASGRRVWQTYMIPAAAGRTGTNKTGAPSYGPAGAGIWSAPTLDPRTGIAYVATGNNYADPATSGSDAVVAVRMRDGRILWQNQVTPDDVYNSGCLAFMDPTRANCPEKPGDDFDFGASPLLVETSTGRTVLVAAQKSGVVYGMDPATGGILWRRRVGKGGPLGGVEWGAATDGKRVYVAVSDCDWKTFQRTVDGKAADVTDLDPDAGGGLFALDPADGGVIWQAPPIKACAGREHCSPAQVAALSVAPGLVFSGSLDGHLRAYAAGDGRVLWDLPTARDFDTVNGVAAHGGAMNGAGPAISGGMVFVNSGYSRFGQAGGNVLLALSVY